MSRLGNLMGIGAERYQRRYRSGGGMPWWQQMLIAQAAGPVVKGVSEFIGEGTKQLFLGKNSQELMEGQRGTDITNLINNTNRVQKGIDRVEAYMRGQESGVAAGQLKNYKRGAQADFEEKHGELSKGNNQVVFDNLWATVTPEVEKVVDEDIRELNEMKDRYKNVPQTLDELERRRQASKGWWGKTTAAQVLAVGKSVFTGIPVSEAVNRSTQKLLLGNDYIKFADTASTQLSADEIKALPPAEKLEYDASQKNKISWANIINGNQAKEDLNIIQNGSILESNQSLRNLIQRTLKDKGMTEFGEYEAKIAHQRADTQLFQGVVQNEIDNSVDTNPAFYDFLLSLKAGEHGQITGILNQLPSYTKMDLVEERSQFMKDIIRSRYHKTILGPIATELQNHMSVAVTPLTESKLFALTNDIYNPRRTKEGLDFGIKGRGRTAAGTFKGKPPSIAELAEDPTEYAAEIKDIQSRVAAIKKVVGQNFTSDYALVIENLRREGIELPLLRESTVKDVFVDYVNDQLNNNVGLKTGLYIDPVTKVETAMATMGLMDEESGANFIRNRITKSNITIKESNTPETPGGKKVEAAIVTDLLNKGTRQDEGFKIPALNDGEREDFRSAFTKLEQNDINKILKNDPTKEGLDTASKLVANFLIEQRDLYNFTNFNHLMFREAAIFRQKLAQQFGINEELDTSSKIMRNLLTIENKDSDVDTGDVEEAITSAEQVARGRQMTKERLQKRREFISGIPDLLTPSEEQIKRRSLMTRTNRQPGLF